MNISVVFAVCLLSILVDPSLQIIGGHEAKEGEYPYDVLLQGCITGLCWPACGGTILNKRYVLTAARCIRPFSPLFYKVNVVVGSLNNFVPDEGAVVLDVANTTQHPKYNDSDAASPYDIAVLRLAEDIVFNKNAQPLKLPAAGSQPPSGQVVFTGRGTIENAPNPYTPPIKPLHLQAVNLTIVGYKECYLAVNTMSDNVINLDKTRNICTGPLTEEKSICQGDAGGALVQNGTVVGVASWGLQPCGQVGAPSVYINTVPFLDWINSVINKA